MELLVQNSQNAFCFDTQSKARFHLTFLLWDLRGISSDARMLALHGRGGGTDARILQTRIYLKAFWFYFSVESVKLCIIFAKV